jgi:hypothetical protein
MPRTLLLRDGSAFLFDGCYSGNMVERHPKLSPGAHTAQPFNLGNSLNSLADNVMHFYLYSLPGDKEARL